ncbi:hypothetical protein [Aurantimonas sp. A3-2-R12]|uniref:hypothetical protein n=1 Tax=Aurantimonas sp. A3-2-R12 TaxID=3114362 RepID=UPI002E182F65|nr:hypothetical protein [Aurantimonas sp. A3-2-R12]
MVANTGLNRTLSMQALLDEITKELMLTGVDQGEGLVALPQTYPGGSSVVVRVRGSDDEFVVTDQGNGYLEAEHLGGTTIFARLAPQIAQFHGVEYDGSCFFAMRVNREWLANAILFIATASRKAVEQTAQRLGEERDHDLKQVFQTAMREFYGVRAVFDYEMRGRSLKQWHFDAAILTDQTPSLIELVSPSHISINSTIVKFGDIARLDDPIRRTVMLTNPGKTTSPDRALLSDSANIVVAFSTNFDTLAKAA